MSNDNDPLDDTAGQPAGTSGALASWSGEYVTDMLGKGRALAEKPYEAYTGPLTAGQSGLQEQAYTGYGGLDTAPSTTVGAYQTTDAPLGYTGGITAGTFGFGDAAGQGYQAGFTPGSYDLSGMQAGTFNAQAAQQYMNPYLQAALAPQIREVTRQADIGRIADASRLTKAGAFGGSRQALMESEGMRNVNQLVADITGKGYAQAFDTAQQQFNVEEQMRQRIAEVGVDQFNKEQAEQRLAEDARRGQFNIEAGRQAEFDEARRGQFNIEDQAARELEERRRSQFNLEADRQRQYEESLRSQFNEEERRRIAAEEADRRYGLSALRDMESAGARQRAIEQEGITADYLQFQQEQKRPYEQIEFMQSLLQGLPVAAKTQSYIDPSSASQYSGALAEILALLGYNDKYEKSGEQSDNP